MTHFVTLAWCTLVTIICVVGFLFLVVDDHE